MTSPGKRISKFLWLVLTLALFAVLIQEALHLPIYPDEVANKILLERFYLNGDLKQMLVPFCARSFRVHVPALLVPAAAFWSQISHLGYRWVSYRLFPVSALAFVILGIILNSAQKGELRSCYFLLLIALGPSIYGLIILRGEIFVLAAALSLFFLARAMINVDSAIRAIVLGATSYAVFVIAVYAHPKAFYLVVVPIAGFVITALCRKKRLPARLIQLPLMVSIVASTLVALQMQHLSCPELPSMEAFIASQAVNPLDAFTRPNAFLHALLLTVSPSIIYDKIMLLQFHTSYSLNYLPPVSSLNVMIRSINVVTIGLVAAAGFYCLAKIGSVLWTAPSRAVRLEVLMIVILALALMIPSALNLSRAWYEGSFFVGGLAIVAALLRTVKVPVSRLAQSSLINVMEGAFAVSMFFCAIVSTVHIHSSMTRRFRAGYEGPGYELGAKNGATRATVEAFASKIPAIIPVIVDDLTYEFLREHQIVLPITYLGLAFDAPATLRASLEANHVQFAITRCVSFVAKAFPDWKLIDSGPFSGTNKQICLFADE